MRNILLLILIAVSFNVYGQESGDSKLVLTTNLSSEENYLALGRALALEEYEIHRRDDTFHRLNTKPRIIQVPARRRDREIYIIIHASCFDDQIVFSAQHKARRQRKIDTTYDIESYQSVGVFKRLEDLATEIGGEISYQP